MIYFLGYGKRKNSRCSLRLSINPSGQLLLNKKTIDDFFVSFFHKEKFIFKLNNLLNSLEISLEQLEIDAKLSSGGVSCQLEAFIYALADALLKYLEKGLDATKFYHQKSLLRNLGLLTVDSRIKERKTPGRKKSRAGRQFSKR